MDSAPTDLMMCYFFSIVLIRFVESSMFFLTFKMLLYCFEKGSPFPIKIKVFPFNSFIL